MNQLLGHILQIETEQSLKLLEIEALGSHFSSLIIEDPRELHPFQIGEQVQLFFKETEISIAKGLSGQLSLRNQIPCIVKQIEKGKILAKIVLDFQGTEITSLITTRSANHLDLQLEDKVTGLIKTNELLIQRITLNKL
ncbi:MAG: TOBE domain-containing protein [Planctomycetota bacterium]